MHIDFLDETGDITKEQQELLLNVLQLASNMEEIPKDAEVSISFVSDEEIHRLNKEYRQIDQPTDVLSFALEEGEDNYSIEGNEIPRMLGDIIVSVDKAKEQAETYNHSFNRELAFLTVHGFLHLLGYDHMSDEDEKKMFSRQEEILHEFGLKR
ncbi:putative rRNA maturation factor [Gracilibacillus halotolerans]|uniref:Endoribonuclease YbeY n=2 Tax=Gracilibacillus halotolerans TaxID=74386 RepID=A0A841RGQ6_9BACI|nr:rRNA maturation RNase YbeY [Gracilibacillus halotolerans]MBB6511821.1 putative rRNA maturation factor [Gracilibacillus halotolerans]